MVGLLAVVERGFGNGDGKEAMNEVEKITYEAFRQRMLIASSYTAIFYFGWRAKRVLKQSKRRALATLNAAKE